MCDMSHSHMIGEQNGCCSVLQYVAVSCRVLHVSFMCDMSHSHMIGEPMDVAGCCSLFHVSFIRDMSHSYITGQQMDSGGYFCVATGNFFQKLGL